MTPEELDQTIEFIIRAQAQFSSDLQREHDMRVQDQPRLAELEEAMKRRIGIEQRIAQLVEIQSQRIVELSEQSQRIVQLIEIQSRRLDRSEEWYREARIDAERRREE